MRRGILLMVLALIPVGMCLADSADPTRLDHTVRVMSFNLRYSAARDGENAWDKRREWVVETIHAFDPDLLGTQETLPDQRDYLEDKLKGYAVLGVGRDDGKEKGEMAAIYYREDRFEKIDAGHFWLSDTPGVVASKAWDAALPRIVAWVKLKDRKWNDAKPILWMNTHFDHVGKTARIESAKLIRQQLDVKGAGCRIVLTGDFNTGEGSEPYKAIFGTTDDTASPLIDTFRAMHPKRTAEEGTFCNFKPNQVRGARFDWIGCSRDWQVRDASIDRTSRDGRTPSDHFPINATLRPKD